MRKFVGAAFASALLFTAAMPNSASAVAVVAPPVVVTQGTSAAAGVGITTGFIGFVALLDLYDIIRRTTCSGDFLGLGGPGFGQAITPGMNVLPPQCVPVVKKKRRHHGQ